MLFLSCLFRQMESPLTCLKRSVEEAFHLGYKSLYIFVTVSTFLGAVTTVQSAYNLSNPFVPRSIIAVLVRDTTILELAPTMMAIVFAGKVGSNISGELGTMRITEQIDAIEGMGVNSISYLVLPKIIATMFMFPILVCLSMFAGIVGGYYAGTLTEVTTSAEFIQGLRYDFIPYNIFFAVVKAVVFAFLVSSISAFTGYYTSGGAFEVGRASTVAVTASCVSILCGDYLLADLLL